MAARLCVVGLSHRTAPVDVRERVAFSEDALPAALNQLSVVMPHKKLMLRPASMMNFMISCLVASADK